MSHPAEQGSAPEREQVGILIVDDEPAGLTTLQAVLEPLACRIMKAASGEQALHILLTEDFAVVLVDVQMPGMDGFETATLIRTRDRSMHTPIMLGYEPGQDASALRLREHHSEWAAKLVLETGIPHAIEHGSWTGETAFVRTDGREVPVSQVILAHRGPDGSVEYLSTIARDMTARN